jgi:hypothetical protein
MYCCFQLTSTCTKTKANERIFRSIGLSMRMMWFPVRYHHHAWTDSRKGWQFRRTDLLDEIYRYDSWWCDISIFQLPYLFMHKIVEWMHILHVLLRLRSCVDDSTVNRAWICRYAFYSIEIQGETRPPFCTAVHFVYILMILTQLKKLPTNIYG